MGSACGGASEATVSGGSTLEQEKKNREAVGAPAPAPTNSAAAAVDDALKKRDPNNPLGFSVAPPAAPPDLTSQAAQQRRASQALLLLAGRGRRQAFLGQGYGPSALSAGGTTLKSG